MANPLTARERAGLKARAHALEPLVHRVGKVVILWLARTDPAASAPADSE